MTSNTTIVEGEAPLSQKFFELGKQQRYELGQPICERRFIPGQVLLIESGNARLLGEEEGRLSTLNRLETGSFIGVVSLLRGAGCETVRAASEVVARSLSDDQLLALLHEDKAIADICRKKLWDAELADLLRILSNRSPKHCNVTKSLLSELKQDAQLLIADDIPTIQSAFNNNLRFFVASRPENESFGMLGDEITDIDAIHDWPKDIHGFPLRLIALPNEALEIFEVHAPSAVLEPEVIGAPSSDATDQNLIPQAPLSPPVSRFNQQGDQSRDFFVAGEGPLEETLACFQMLTKLMKLPFRRDAIERVLRDQVRRSQTPTLRLCGQIAASLGLHVAGAKVAASMGVRLQTPTLIPWGQSFAIAIRSDQRGLVLASPSQGFLEITPDQLESSFPEGIDLLLLDRTSTTPEETFGPSWFWPALNRYRGVLIQVLAASFVVQLFTLANPLLIQVIIDKEINQRSLDT